MSTADIDPAQQCGQALNELEAKNYTKSLELTESGIQTWPHHADFYFIRSLCLTHLARTNEAIDSLDKMLSMYPNHEPALAFYKQLTGSLPSACTSSYECDLEVHLLANFDTQSTSQVISAKEYCLEKNTPIKILDRLGQYTCSNPIEIYELEKFLLTGSRGAIFSCDGRLLTDSSFYSNYNNTLEAIFWHSIKLRETDLVKGNFLLLNGIWSNSFWHWMMEYLPSFLIAQAAGYEFEVIISDTAPKFINDILQMLDFPADKIKILTHNFAWLEKIILPERIRAGNSLSNYPELISLIRNKLLAKSSSKNDPSKIFISRRDSKNGRNVVNEDDLHKLLNKYKFSIVEMATLPIKEQISLMSECTHLITPHGAGMTHTIFMPPESTVIELFSPIYVNPCMTPVMRHLNHNYHMLVSTNLDQYAHGREVMVNLEQLEQILIKSID